MRLAGSFVNIATPDERGAHGDFLMCLLDDGYGISQVIDQPANILDIGANLGFFALAARSFFPESTIHCYEPNPRILPYLHQNALAASAEVFCEAIGVAEGVVFLEEQGDSNQARTTGAKSGVSVPQITLAQSIDRLNGQIDLAKIDCEGAEWEMFENPEPWKYIRHLRMEYHLGNQKCFQEVASKLATFGFTIFRHYPADRWGTIWAKRTD